MVGPPLGSRAKTVPSLEVISQNIKKKNASDPFPRRVSTKIGYHCTRNLVDFSFKGIVYRNQTACSSIAKARIEPSLSRSIVANSRLSVLDGNCESFRKHSC